MDMVALLRWRAAANKKVYVDCDGATTSRNQVKEVYRRVMVGGRVAITDSASYGADRAADAGDLLMVDLFC